MAHLSTRQKEQYEDEGFVLIPGFYPESDAHEMAGHCSRLFDGAGTSAGGANASGPSDKSDQPYPRLINPHAWDSLAKQWAMHTGLLGIVEELLGQKAVLQVSMFYLKPPGARGQALHQTHQFVSIDPLVSMWTALDVSDRDTGQIVIVPRSHKRGLLPVATADTTQSFVNARTIVPADLEETGIDMQPGDVLLFHALTIHGSYSNTTSDRYRRSFNCTYIGEHSQSFEPPPGTHVSHLKD